MIEIGVAPDPNPHEFESNNHCLVVNGQLIENSSVPFYIRNSDDENIEHICWTWVGDATAVTLLSQCQLTEIVEHFDQLFLELSDAPSEHFPEVGIFCELGTESLCLVFSFEADLKRWAKPWSANDFGRVVKRVTKDHNIPGLDFYDDEDLPSRTLFDPSFVVKVNTPEETVQQALESWSPIIRDLCEEAEAVLTAKVRQGSLVALFTFAPEVKTACAQYLLYFAQFLEDLGIHATVDLHEQARSVLFAVTPASGPEALERIREALDVYLQIPDRPDFDAEAMRYPDVAVQQYAANVHHLRSQLLLAQALLQTKEATIEALQAANLHYKQLLSPTPASQGALPGASKAEMQGDVPFLDGLLVLKKFSWKALEIDLPRIFRMLRRTLRRPTSQE